MSFFNAIISAIMSFLMLIFPWMQPSQPIEPATQVIEVNSIVSDMEDAYKTGKGFIISSYFDWKNYAPLKDNSEVIPYDAEFFKDNSLVIVEIARPSSDYEVKFNGTQISNSWVHVNFSLVCGNELGGTDAICYTVIVVPVNKDVTNVVIDTKEVNVNEIQHVSLISGPESGDARKAVYSSYADWNNSYVAQRSFAKYYNKEFFDRSSLAVVVVTHADTSYANKVVSCVENGNTLDLEYEIVQEDMLGFCVVTFEAILVPVSKNITDINAVDVTVREY